MRYLALLLLACALGAADMRQLGPNEDLPYCRVITNDAASIDKDAPVYSAHDGWYCAQTGHLYPTSAKGVLFDVSPLDKGRIVKVTVAAMKPWPMPVEWRRDINTYIGKNHPKVADNDPMAAKP